MSPNWMRINKTVLRSNFPKSPFFARFVMLVMLAAISMPGASQQRRSGPATGAKQPPLNQPAVLNMRLENGRVTATIANSPLQVVLKDFADRTGIVFEVRSQRNPEVFVNLYGVSLEEAIERITPGFNTIFFYDKNSTGSAPIKMVQVFPRGDKDPQPSIMYLGTGVVTKTNDTLENTEQALRALEESKDAEIKEQAIEILANAGSEEGIKALIKAISDSDPAIRVAAIEGLAALNIRAALPDILKSLKDRHPAVRQSAATVTALLGTAQNVKDLRPLRADRDAGVAAAAETAIRTLSTAVGK